MGGGLVVEDPIGHVWAVEWHCASLRRAKVGTVDSIRESQILEVLKERIRKEREAGYCRRKDEGMEDPSSPRRWKDETAEIRLLLL